MTHGFFASWRLKHIRLRHIIQSYISKKDGPDTGSSYLICILQIPSGRAFVRSPLVTEKSYEAVTWCRYGRRWTRTKRTAAFWATIIPIVRTNRYKETLGLAVESYGYGHGTEIGVVYPNLYPTEHRLELHFHNWQLGTYPMPQLRL